MRAIALRLEGPLQSWGGPVAGDDRPTLDVPTKSGVVGIVAAALGIERSDVAALAELHRGLAVHVRVDARGRRGVDFHTSLEVPQADGKLRKNPVVSRRSYLYDASFVALLVDRGEAGLDMEVLLEAMQYPRFLPYLGRKACVPSLPMLAAPEIIDDETWSDLFEHVVLSPNHPSEGPEEFFLEGRHTVDGVVRTLRLRDEFVGPLQRMFGERIVTHVSRAAQAGAGDTVDPWYPL